jgi:hypothetical protein
VAWQFVRVAVAVVHRYRRGCSAPDISDAGEYFPERGQAQRPTSHIARPGKAIDVRAEQIVGLPASQMEADWVAQGIDKGVAIDASREVHLPITERVTPTRPSVPIFTRR